VRVGGDAARGDSRRVSGPRLWLRGAAVPTWAWAGSAAFAGESRTCRADLRCRLPARCSGEDMVGGGALGSRSRAGASGSVYYCVSIAFEDGCCSESVGVLGDDNGCWLRLGSNKLCWETNTGIRGYLWEVCCGGAVKDQHTPPKVGRDGGPEGTEYSVRIIASRCCGADFGREMD